MEDAPVLGIMRHQILAAGAVDQLMKEHLEMVEMEDQLLLLYDIVLKGKQIYQVFIMD